MALTQHNLDDITRVLMKAWGRIAWRVAALTDPMDAAARIAEVVHPSAASAIDEAYKRHYRDTVAHAIRDTSDRQAALGGEGA